MLHKDKQCDERVLQTLQDGNFPPSINSNNDKNNNTVDLEQIYNNNLNNNDT